MFFSEGLKETFVFGLGVFRCLCLRYVGVCEVFLIGVVFRGISCFFFVCLGFLVVAPNGFDMLCLWRKTRVLLKFVWFMRTCDRCVHVAVCFLGRVDRNDEMW